MGDKVGLGFGNTIGFLVGDEVIGDIAAFLVGGTVRSGLGAKDGTELGAADGISVGPELGFLDSAIVGLPVGFFDGVIEGLPVGFFDG